jgi:phosphotransferase system enzyme I (PtsI)
VFVNPTDQTLFEYGQLARRRIQLEERLQEIRSLPAVTLDGTRIVLSANLELAEDAGTVAEAGAEGVGLFRTEYLFLNSDSLPDEEAQFAAYRTVAEAVKPSAVIIRTLDIGGDKFIPHLPMPKGGQSLPRLARDPLLPPSTGSLPHPAPRHPPRQRPRERQTDVPPWSPAWTN